MYFRDDITFFLFGCAHKRIYFPHNRTDTVNFGKVGHLAIREQEQSWFWIHDTVGRL